MKICLLSDTHNKHKKIKLPEANMIIHAGDFTSVGKEHEVRNFMKWYSKLPYTHKLIIAGNHDWLFETSQTIAKELIPNNIIYLEDSGVEIEGLYFYGSPVQKPFNNWAFNRPEEKLKQHWQAIPDKTDILITHSPPHEIGDYAMWSEENCGSPSLRDEIVNRIKPLVHIYGHVHEDRGIYHILDSRTTFINASNLDGTYRAVNMPILIEIEDNVVKILES